jgi:hypothetical protein
VLVFEYDVVGVVGQVAAVEDIRQFVVRGNVLLFRVTAGT